MAAVDVEVLEELGELIEDMTTTGKPSLDETQIKRLKNICKISNSYVGHAFHLVMTQLKKKHSEIRLSSFQIISELFSRSNHFRELLLGEFRLFLDLVVGSDPKQPLPPPVEIAKTLKTKAIDAIESWQQKYGSSYKKLDLGYQFLKRIKHVDFEGIRNRTLVVRRRAEDREQRKQRILQKKVDEVENEIAEQIGHIELSLTEINNCFKLILPPPCEYEVHGIELASSNSNTSSPGISNLQDRAGNFPTSEVSENEQKIANNTKQITGEKNESSIGELVTDEKISDTQKQSIDDDCNDADTNNTNHTEMDVLKSHGLGSRTYEININVKDMQPSVDETEDNSIVLETAREIDKEITHNYLPMISRWLQVFSKAGHNQQRIQSVIDLKRQLQSARDQFIELNISPSKKNEHDIVNDDVDDDNDDDDDEFVDVPEKEGIEYIPPEKRAEYGLEPLNDSNKKENAAATTAPPATDDKAILERHGFTLKDAEDPTSHARAILEAGKRNSELVAPKPNINKSSTTHIPAVAKTTASHNDEKRRQELLEKAPVINFDMDLYHWDDPNYEPPKIIRSHNFNNYWASKDAETEQIFEQAKPSMVKRKICFGGKFEPVKWSCRAPLPSGKLCPRKDRYKCPFHGVIVQRDEAGRPVEQGSPATPAPSTSTSNQNESWKDIQIDIESATGVDLGRRNKRKARKPASDQDKLSRKQKYARLTDIQKSSKTPRSRLEKKVLSKDSMKRIAEEMDNLATKKVLDKFGDQFNYQLH